MSLLKLLSFKSLMFICLFLTLFTRLEIVDLDYFYHVKTGEYITQHISLPATDIFAYTMSNKHWIVHEWLFEVITYWSKVMGNDIGVKLLTTGLFTLSLWLIFKLIEKFTPPFLLSIFTIIYCYLLMQGGFSPRPHLTTYVFLPIYLTLILDIKYFTKINGIWFLPVIMVLWTNMHGGYMLGAIVLVSFLISEFLIQWFNEFRNKAYLNHLKQLGWVTLITLIATGIKPTGFSEWLFPFHITSLEHIKYVQEWQSPTFDNLHGKLYLLIVVLFFLCAIFRTKKSDITELGLPVALLSLGFISIRHVPLATMTLSIFIVIFYRELDLSVFRRIYEKIKPPIQLKRSLNNGKQLGNIEYVLNWVMLAIVLIIFTISYPIYQQKHQVGFYKKMPVKAVEFIKNNQISGNVFNTQPIGGYLINQFYPDKKVFIDGRGGDLYGDEFYLNYIKIINLARGWEELFNRFNINYMLVEHYTPLAQMKMANNEYKLVYDDGYYSVLLKNTPENQSIIKKFERSWLNASIK